MLIGPIVFDQLQTLDGSAGFQNNLVAASQILPSYWVCTTQTEVRNSHSKFQNLIMPELSLSTSSVSSIKYVVCCHQTLQILILFARDEIFMSPCPWKHKHRWAADKVIIGFVEAVQRNPRIYCVCWYSKYIPPWISSCVTMIATAPVSQNDLFPQVSNSEKIKAYRQCDKPVNRSQQRLCKLLMPNEKGHRFAKRVGRKPSLTWGTVVGYASKNPPLSLSQSAALTNTSSK